MLLRYTGCLLGAAIGDAMGMAAEGTPADLWRAECSFRRAYRGHPNDTLSPGQYTDDTQSHARHRRAPGRAGLLP